MRIDICVVLVSAFIEKHEIWLSGSPEEQFYEVMSQAESNYDEEIIDCLNRIKELDMIKHCFSEM